MLKACALCGVVGWSVLPWVLMILAVVAIARLRPDGWRLDAVRRSAGERWALWCARRAVVREGKEAARARRRLLAASNWPTA